MHESIVAGPAPNCVPGHRFTAFFDCKDCWHVHHPDERSIRFLRRDSMTFAFRRLLRSGALNDGWGLTQVAEREVGFP